MENFPDYLNIPGDELGRNTPVQVRILTDMASIARDLAAVLFHEIGSAKKEGRASTLIVPVGPVDQFPILAAKLNAEKLSCRDVMFINMDEYLTDAGDWISEEHPLSFRGYMNRAFYDLLDPSLAPLSENRVFPDPQCPGAMQTLIDARGGVDACFGGIGVNGHLAFNEPPEPGETISPGAFAVLPTRVLTLARETRAINSVTVGGEISLVPRRAVTVGMKEILASRRLRFYCNRPWQSAVVRKALHGPISSGCPASFLRLHPDACLTVADYVAAAPRIQLR